MSLSSLQQMCNAFSLKFELLQDFFYFSLVQTEHIDEHKHEQSKEKSYRQWMTQG